MPWEKGAIELAANFHNSTKTPLDGKQIVPTPNDLEDIESPYSGLVVSVQNTGLIYMCFDPDAVPTSSIINGNQVNPSVWKQIIHTTVDGGTF